MHVESRMGSMNQQICRPRSSKLWLFIICTRQSANATLLVLPGISHGLPKSNIFKTNQSHTDKLMVSDCPRNVSNPVW